jgi:chromosome partitioning protein
MHTLSIVNQKGGVGKTTTTIALATFMHHRGFRHLVIDMDAQMNATAWLLGRQLKENEASIYNCLITKKRNVSEEADWPLGELIEESQIGFDYVPASRMLSAADSELSNEPHLLADRLDEMEASQKSSDERYDFCLIDCPPALGTLVYVTLCASDGFIVPIDADRFSMDGLEQLIQTARKARRVNHDLEMTGLLLNGLDWRYGLTKNTVELMEEEYGDQLFSTKVPLRARIKEAGAGKDLRIHADGEDTTEIYDQLLDELLERVGIDPHAIA